VSTYYDENELDDNVPIKSNVLKRLFSTLRPHWKALLGGVIAIVVVSLLDAYFTILSKRIIDEGIILQNKAAILRLFTIYGAIVLVQAVSVFFFVYLVGLQGEGVRYDLRKNLFNHLQDLSLSYFSKTPLGWIMSRVTSDTEKMAELLTWGVIDTAYAAVSIVVSAIFMLTINWQLAIIVLLSLPVMIYAALKFRLRIYHHYRLSRKANSRMTASLNENITGVRVVKALRREDRNLNDFKVLSSAMYRSSYRAAYLSALFQPTIQKHLRSSEEAMEDEFMYYVYLLDEQERLRGVISLRDLVTAPLDQPLSDWIDDDIAQVTPLTPQEEAAYLVAKYDLMALPVVEPESKKMIGIVTVDDALDTVLPTAWKKKLPRFSGK